MCRLNLGIEIVFLELFDVACLSEFESGFGGNKSGPLSRDVAQVSSCVHEFVPSSCSVLETSVIIVVEMQ